MKYYRPDIDGLRTLAVLPVILFHAGASWMPGGFIGVDIFFVISGYLISSIILREMQAGKFSILRFYERRLRRIIPALLVVLLVTVAAFQMIALPDQAQGAAESGIAALLSMSNFYFWQESGYFAPTAEFMPLLHTWSLGVEEQFYLIFPVIILMIWKLRLPMKLAIVLGTVVAFGFGLWLSINKPSMAYYLLPARSWELAIGAIIAAGAVPQIRGPILREVMTALGVGMILFALFWIRSDMVFPGWVALMPCIGAAMVIHSGGQSWVARQFLGARPMVFIGLLSYSLYLWHWPVLAALRVRTASIHLDPGLAAAGIVATFLLAWLSWRFVEQPFRNRASMDGKRLLSLTTSGAAAVLSIAGLSIIASGFPSRLPPPARDALAAATDIDPRRYHCERMADPDQCRFGNVIEPIRLAIIGDSHAAALRPAFDGSDLLMDGAGMLYWSGSCAFLDGTWTTNGKRTVECNKFREAVWQQLENNHDLKVVVLAGRWPVYYTGTTPESGGSNRSYLVDNETNTPSLLEAQAVFRRAISRTIDRLLALGVEVVIVGTVPEPGYDVPATVALSRYHNLAEPGGPTRAAVEARMTDVETALGATASAHPAVSFLSIWQEFCPDAQCIIEHDGAPIYHDEDHLSLSGAATIARQAIKRIEIP